MQNKNGSLVKGQIGRMLLLIGCSGIFGMAISAQTPAGTIPKADPRVAKALKETNTEFDLSSKDGMYKVTYGTKGKRVQTTHVASATEDINGVEMRLIFSFSTILKALPSHETANLLLQDNMERIGRWAVQKLDDGSWAILSLIYIPASSGGKQLEAALMTIATQADEMEEQLTKKDVN